MKDEKPDIAGEAMEQAGQEIAALLFPYFAARASFGGQVAAATGALLVATGAMKASRCSREMFLSIAGKLWDKTVIITPEQALTLMADRGEKQC
jgi:hypothetical protein